jgi:hypothetical protein
VAAPPDGEARQIERAVLEIVLELHPDHLTVPELVLKVAADRDQVEGEDVRLAVRDLRASGLLRYVGDLVVPTHAALRAFAILLAPGPESAGAG